MSEGIRVHVERRDYAEDRHELILESAEGKEIRWSKMYHGSLFLNLDAQSLGLLETISEAPASGPRLRMKRTGIVDPEQLQRMKFSEDKGSR